MAHAGVEMALRSEELFDALTDSIDAVRQLTHRVAATVTHASLVVTIGESSHDRFSRSQTPNEREQEHRKTDQHTQQTKGDADHEPAPLVPG